ncbi:MAG: hypothetical protein K2M12_02060, partial [Muribaculaceae bacterium]|nr:hypothetical protein [Muribaculaceae bacterium]
MIIRSKTYTEHLLYADYSPATGADEDFSVRYTYDNMARPKTVARQGITDVDADGAETFGTLDHLSYTYDAAGRVSTIGNDPDGDEYYGRPGFSAAGSDYSWDNAGRMTADTGRDITLIKYDQRNLPTELTFGDGHRVSNIYDASGALVRTTHIPRSIAGAGFRPSVRTYAADRVWQD